MRITAAIGTVCFALAIAAADAPLCKEPSDINITVLSKHRDDERALKIKDELRASNCEATAYPRNNPNGRIRRDEIRYFSEDYRPAVVSIAAFLQKRLKIDLQVPVRPTEFQAPKGTIEIWLSDK
jgi:hypothetical protein